MGVRTVKMVESKEKQTTLCIGLGTHPWGFLVANEWMANWFETRMVMIFFLLLKKKRKKNLP